VGLAGRRTSERRPTGDPGRLASTASDRRPTDPFSIRDRRGPWRDALLRRMLAGADVAAVLAASLAAGIPNPEGIVTALWSLALLPLWIVGAKLHGLYDHDQERIRHLTIDELPGLFRWVTISVAITALVIAVGPSPLTPTATAVMWVVAFGTAVLLRFAVRFAWRRLVPPARGLVIGHGQLARAVTRKLALERGHHLALVAALPAGDAERGEKLDRREPAEVVADLESTIRRERVERVILAMPDLDEVSLSGIVATCRSMEVKLSVAPPLRAMLGTAVRLNHLAELPLIEFRTWNPSRSTMFLKRALDAVLATVALVLISPLLAAIAVLIRLDSPGGALFRQERAGLGGRPFRVLKFRTMVRDAEALLPELIEIEELSDPMFKLRKDPRVTRIGRVLRRTSVDELPQLLNVIKGDMSLVGPRPEEVWLVERYEEELQFRLQMRPGVTGPMQVHGRGELTFQERVAVEREYIENYSLRKDVKLLLQTVAAVAHRRGAY